jgi:hypothetical protein
MKILRDPYVILLAILLIATLAAFFLGVLPYPVGVLVLVVLLMFRIRSIRNPEDRTSKGNSPSDI